MKRWRTDGRNRVALALVALAWGVSAAAFAEQPAVTSSGFSPAKLQRVSDYMKNEVATGKIPGAIVLIQQHGRPVYHQKFGVRDVETGQPLSDDTIFRLYSMSKPVTSVAAMMLVDDCKLKHDDPLSIYFPAFTGVKVGVEKRDDSGKVTLAL